MMLCVIIIPIIIIVAGRFNIRSSQHNECVQEGMYERHDRTQPSPPSPTLCAVHASASETPEPGRFLYSFFAY